MTSISSIMNPAIAKTNPNYSLISQAYEINYPRYVGYQESDTPIRHEFFNLGNLRIISNKITKNLNNVHPEGKTIKVPDQSILQIMTDVSLNNYNDLQLMNDMVVSIITNQIKDEFETIAQNNKLNIWVTQYTSDTGLRRTSEIKIRDKHPTRMVFNMNY